MEQNFVSENNSTSTALNNGETFTGKADNVSMFDSLVIALKTDQSGILYVDFSVDGTNFDSTLTFLIAANVNEVHRITITRKWYRIRIYNNSGSNQTYLRAQTIFGNYVALTSPLNGSIQADADSIVSRSILIGKNDSGNYATVPIDTQGHLEVAIHSPRLPFGSIHTESLSPVFQTDYVYGINQGQNKTVSSGSGSVTGVDGMAVCSTGTTIYSQAVLLGRKRLRYRAGQGIVGRFTALFTTPVANSYQLAGFGTSEAGVYFGYGNTSDLSDTRFGVLYVTGGVRETRTLTITTASSTTQNVTVTLNGVAYTVAVTNSANIQRTVYELSLGTYAGWDVYPSGATLVFVNKSAGAKSGAYSISGTTVVGAFAQTIAGIASTDTFIAQEDFNGDKLDGTGSSGITIDPTKGNVFQIDIQYLGFGTVVFKVESAPIGNNATWVVAHTLNLPNTLIKPNFSNPSFPFTMAAYSAGSTTNLSVKSASVGGFIEGYKVLHGNRFSYYNQLTTVGASNYHALFSVMNGLTYGGKANQAVINLLSISGAVKHTSPVIYYLVRNATLLGNPNFQTLSTNSCSVWDTAATTGTWASGDQLIWSGHLGETGELDHHFGNGTFNAEEVTIQPGEMITLFALATAGTPSYVTGGLNTREDQ